MTINGIEYSVGTPTYILDENFRCFRPEKLTTVAVDGDNDSSAIILKTPRYYKNLDLSQISAWIYWSTEWLDDEGKPSRGKKELVDFEVGNEEIVYLWLLDIAQTYKKGKVNFGIGWTDGGDWELNTKGNYFVVQKFVDRLDSYIAPDIAEQLQYQIDKLEETKADKLSLDNHIADKNNPHEVTKAQTGLGNVDNTSDIDKPISTATQVALNLKADKSTTYTKTEVDNTLNLKANITYVDQQDNNLQEQIDTIASSSDVVDVVGTYAELEVYDTQHLKDNDIIKVLQDETKNNAITYYRWVINQQTHVGSWEYIGASGPYYTKGETDTLLDEKQNTLTAGENITINNNVISAPGLTVDQHYNPTSENAQSGIAVAEALEDIPTGGVGRKTSEKGEIFNSYPDGYYFNPEITDSDLVTFNGTKEWSCFQYRKTWGTIEAGNYRFEMDCLIYSGVPVIQVGSGRLGEEIEDYQTNIKNVYDKEHGKYIFSFTLVDDWDGNLGILIGNYGGTYGDSGDAHFICANPSLYLLDNEGNPVGSSLINTFNEDYYNDSSSTVNNKWNRKTPQGYTCQPLSVSLISGMFNNNLKAGYLSHAEGEGTWATAKDSHAEGRGNNFECTLDSYSGNVLTLSPKNNSSVSSIRKNAVLFIEQANGGKFVYAIDSPISNGDYYNLSINQELADITTPANVKVIMGGSTSSWSHTEGNFTNAADLSATDLEDTADAQTRQHAEGSRTLATGYVAHAEGEYTQALGNHSHAEGQHSVSSGVRSHAEGGSTLASGDSSHAEGRNTEASGESAHAEGYQTSAIGGYSHAGGYGTIADGDAETVIGQYNSPVSGDLFEVGNGVDEDNRNNAFRVTQDGKVYGGTQTQDNDTSLVLTTKQYVDSGLSSKLDKFDVLANIDYEPIEENNAIIGIRIIGRKPSVPADKFIGNIELPSTITYNGVDYPVIALGYTTAVTNANFQNCAGITGVYIPPTVTYIGHSFFRNTGLINIYIPYSVTKIWDSCFEGCKNLQQVKIANPACAIREFAFKATAISSVKCFASSGVAFVEQQTYNDCRQLQKVFIGKGIVSIRTAVFFWGGYQSQGGYFSESITDVYFEYTEAEFNALTTEQKESLTTDSFSNGVTYHYGYNSAAFDYEVALATEQYVQNYHDTTKQNITDNSLNTTNKTIPNAINEVYAMALGSQTGIAYTDYKSMIDTFNILPADDFFVGKNIYIQTVDVPDLWIEINDESTSVPYDIFSHLAGSEAPTFTANRYYEKISNEYVVLTTEPVNWSTNWTDYYFVDDNSFVNTLDNNGYVQVGYYKLAKLETGKVDLDNYYTKTQTDTLLADKLTEPSSGLAVGKWFRVASINADGHAVLECVDAPTFTPSIKEGTTAPTTSTVADYIGQLYHAYSATSPKIDAWYTCVEINNNTYTWKQIYLSDSLLSIVIGNKRQETTNDKIIIGNEITTGGTFGRWTTTVGYANTNHANFGTAIAGYAASVAPNAVSAIQLGTGANNTANTFNVGFYNVGNYRLLEANGTIPPERLTTPQGAEWTDAQRLAVLQSLGCTVESDGTVKWTAQT